MVSMGVAPFPDVGSGPWGSEFIGLETQTPVASGASRRFVNLDNAATTPPLRAVVSSVQKMLRLYASVHRGAGLKSRASTDAYETARFALGHFVGADPERHTVVFVKNTTEAINKLAARLPVPTGSIILTTMMEHHSNDLPWRRRGPVVRVRVTADGRLDEDDFDAQLARYAGRIALVAVSGASNVTGFVQPVHRLARKAHAAGAPIFVDAAQLVAHRRLDIRPAADPEHLDFVAFSGHKMYAPFGSGVLVGPRETFETGDPDHVGGGTVDLVTEQDVVWTGAPDRDEAGTPNAVGAIAMAAAARVLTDWGFDRIAAHEHELASHARRRLEAIGGVTLYGEPPAGVVADRVGVIPFNVAGVDHAMVAAVLGYEGGVGVRSGCFCAQIYVAHLLGLDAAAARPAGSDQPRPGMVRLSLGAYNTREDVDAAVDVVEAIAEGRLRARYTRISPTEYRPVEATAAARFGRVAGGGGADDLTSTPPADEDRQNASK